MFGILNLQKPEGVTSRDVVNVVQRIVRPVKVGHAGTLDPMATGVLLVCVGKSTKLISLLQQASKVYEAEFVLGQRSDTDDATGAVTDQTDAVEQSRDEIEAALQTFVGRIDQVPPAYSAVKVKGQRAYTKARRGEEFELTKKQVVVHQVDLLDYTWPRVTLRIRCGSGTYIRSIARDLGELLGCGGLMSGLVRTAIGEFQIQQAISPAELRSDNLVDLLTDPVTTVSHLSQYRCTAADEMAVALGRQVVVQPKLWQLPSTEPVCEEGRVALTSTDGRRLLALGVVDPDTKMIQPRTVFME